MIRNSRNDTASVKGDHFVISDSQLSGIPKIRQVLAMYRRATAVEHNVLRDVICFPKELRFDIAHSSRGKFYGCNATGGEPIVL